MLVDVDLFSADAPADAVARLFRVIDATPHVDWLLLTKRPENIRRMWPLRDLGERSEAIAEGDYGYYRHANHAFIRKNVWLGTSIACQEDADKNIPELLKCRDLCGRLAVHVVPVEEVRIAAKWFGPQSEGQWLNVVECGHKASQYGINWVTIAGEIGKNARPTNPLHVRSLVSQCRGAGVPVWVERLGSNIVTRNDMVEDDFNGRDGWPDPVVEHHIHGFREDFQSADCRIRLRDRNGADPSEWPEDLRVREVPT